MKIVAPPLLQTLPIAPTSVVAPAAQPLHSPTQYSAGTSPQQVSRFAAALVQHSRILSQRELVASANALQSRAVKLGELYQLLMGTQDTGLDTAAALLRKKLLLQNSTDLSQIMDYADGDAAKAHVVLQAARKQAQADGAMGEHVVLTHQLKLLRRKYGTRARAGINTAKAFARTHIDNKRRAALRNLYNVAVSGQPNITGLIEALLSEQEEPGQFDLNLRDMRSAIADDLSALTPSASHEQLRTLMHGLNTARHVTTLLRGCEHLLGRMRNKNPDLKVDPPAFLKHLLTLTANGMNVNQTLQLTQHIGGKQLKHQLAFLNALRPMLLQLPILLWRDMKSRQNALNNLLILMAELTQQEQKQLYGGLVR
ncbi:MULTISPECIES: type III secretion system gatekeeper subunit SctW [unclassified Pseudomonas]|uniref:type III secretion system gatekeeper subunit SctW n=1 Tax=unclassified Pseudomonas TaxID=196821 RepID=UPI002AC91C55|nr:MULTISPECIES: type III secretion system gatekeeper subunit SctW [unclassified Pseudomonas]MEB0046709.1 type III secretion system gatekeeper subunit SctW [Pseudomonas sp. Dout3]MEB0098591.1 type III secretion system gatekeeper subunit SctW [Pseudomonas sp. DC1.2]WPX56636.1 type III secretion system gatekeeper subunit SctW [Pseudomonas sp. DC1.2]